MYSHYKCDKHRKHINNASIERSINSFFIPTETLHFRHLHHLSFYLLSYRVCFLHPRWVTLDDSYSSTIEFLCYKQPCFPLRFFFSHLNQLNSRSRRKQGKNGLVRVCIYNGREKEETSIEGLYRRQGVKWEREREIRYWFELDTAWGTVVADCVSTMHRIGHKHCEERALGTNDGWPRLVSANNLAGMPS